MNTQSRAGLSLVEVLVVVAVVAVLLALVVPVARSVRLKSRQSEILATLRSHAATFGAYANDYRGSTPQVAPAEDGEFVIAPPGLSITVTMKYPWTWGYWHFALSKKYYDEEVMTSAFYAPGEPRGSVTNYQMSCAFLADSEFWDPSTRTGPNQWRAKRLDDVVATSSKVLLASDSPAPVDSSNRLIVGPTAMALLAWVDGSSSAVSTSALFPGYPRGDGPWAFPYHQGETWPLGGHTLQGVRGRDRR